MINPLKAGRKGVVARRRVGVGLLGAAGSLALAPCVAHAEAATSVEGLTVVGAAPGYGAGVGLAKLPVDPHDIPQSITVLDRELLQAQGATSLADALRNVPGVTIGGAEGGQIGNNINLNGFSARTDIFLDGMRDRGQYYRDTFALESVDVLMGPSSMLFGRGSTGGAVNQVSKRPSLHPFTEMDVSGTTNGLARAVVDVNAPLADDVAARLAVMGQSGAVSTRDKTTVHDYGLAPSVTLGAGTPTQLTFSGLFQHNNDRPDYGVPPLNGGPVQSGRDTVYGYSTDRTVQTVGALQAEFKHRFDSGVLLRNQLQYNTVKVDAVETAPQGIGTVGAKGFAPLTPAGVSGLPLDALSVRLQSHDRVIHDSSLYDQFEASGTFATGPIRHAVLAGLEIGHDSYRNQANTRTGACNGAALPTGYTGCVSVLFPAYTVSPNVPEIAGNLAQGKADSQAAYLNDTAQITSQLKLIGGVRFDRYAASITNSINSGNTAGNTSFASLSQTVHFASIRSGLIWQPTTAQSYYASYSTSFNPSLEQLVSTTGLSQPLPPETNKAYEVGGKWDVLHGQLDVTAALFQITQDNSRSQNSDNTYTANGTIRVRGARVGAVGRLTPDWQLFAGYTHLNGKIIQAVAPGTQGMVPANTPSDSATIWTTYDLSPAWQVGGGAVYVSKRYAANTDAVAAPSYVRFDATVAWRQPGYELRLNVFNLFNKTYYDSLIQSDGGRIVPGTGRTAMLTVVVRR
jgi:catecholate siderophore receptor